MPGFDAGVRCGFRAALMSRAHQRRERFGVEGRQSLSRSICRILLVASRAATLYDSASVG